MKYKELISAYKKKGYHLIKYGSVLEDRKYDLFKIVINNGSKKSFLITTGFHGEEFNGPISILKIIDDVVEYASLKKVNLIVYICVNPSGFDKHKRYNLSDENQNNDFIRYLVNKKWVIGLDGKKFQDVKIIEAKAKESRILKNDILDFGTVPVGVLDIHQDDDITKGDFYAYISNNRDLYEKIMKKVDKVAKRSRNTKTKNFDNDGNAIIEIIDKEGFREVRDSGLSDLFFVFESKFAVTIETNIKLRLSKVSAVNKIWIKEMINLVADSKELDKKFPKR